MRLWEAYLKNSYKILDVLKDTGENKVILAYDKRGRQNCVLKECSPRSRALYETLKEIKNPHIPAIYRLIEQEGKLLVIEEYIEGRTLAELFQSAPTQSVDETLAFNILRQLCECLAPLHARGIVHRDIKPSNLIWTKDGVLKLIDFGIARTEKQGTDTDTEFLGTRGYAPPEQYGFGQTDARSDIYALGVTMQRALGAGYSGYLKDALSRCTALDPGNRYPSVEALLKDVERQKKGKSPRKTAAILLSAAVLSGLALYGVINHWPPREAAPMQETTVQTGAPSTEPTHAAAPLPLPSTTEIPQPSAPDSEPTAPAPSVTVTPETDRAAKKTAPPQDAALVMASPRFLYSAPWKEKVHCSLFLNGEPADGFSLPYAAWETWRQENGDVIFPSDWKLSLRIENRSSQTISHPRIRMESFTGEEWLDAPPIPAGQSVEVSVPFDRWPLRDMKTFTLALFFTEKYNPSEPQAGVTTGFGLRP